MLTGEMESRRGRRERAGRRRGGPGGAVPGPWRRAAAAAGDWALLRQAELERLIGRARLAAAGALLEAGDWMAATDAAAAARSGSPTTRRRCACCCAPTRWAAGWRPRCRVRQRQGTAGRGTGHRPVAGDAALYTAILRGELDRPGARPAPAAWAWAASDWCGRAWRAGRCLDDDWLAAPRSRRMRAEVIVVDGEAGIGKTTLLRAWAARRAAAGDTVLLASCGPLDRAMPLDALLTALAGLLRQARAGDERDMLGSDAAVLAPVLVHIGAAAPAARAPALADSMLGPAVLYSALVRVLGRLAEHAPLVVVVDDAHLAGPALADWLRFLRREDTRAMVVAAVRSGEGEPLPATALHAPGRARPGRGRRAGRAGPGRRAVCPVQGASAVPDRTGPAGRGRRTARLAGRVGVRALRRAGRGRAAAARPPP